MLNEQAGGLMPMGSPDDDGPNTPLPPGPPSPGDQVAHPTRQWECPLCVDRLHLFGRKAELRKHWTTFHLRLVWVCSCSGRPWFEDIDGHKRHWQSKHHGRFPALDMRRKHLTHRVFACGIAGCSALERVFEVSSDNPTEDDVKAKAKVYLDHVVDSHSQADISRWHTDAHIFNLLDQRALAHDWAEFKSQRPDLAPGSTTPLTWDAAAAEKLIAWLECARITDLNDVLTRATPPAVYPQDSLLAASYLGTQPPPDDDPFGGAGGSSSASSSQKPGFGRATGGFSGDEWGSSSGGGHGTAFGNVQYSSYQRHGKGVPTSGGGGGAATSMRNFDALQLAQYNLHTAVGYAGGGGEVDYWGGGAGLDLYAGMGADSPTELNQGYITPSRPRTGRDVSPVDYAYSPTED